MPRRNNEQKFKRNAHRRDNTTRNRKAVFCMKHLELTRPEIFKETVALYEFVNNIYPCKHDLTKTTLYEKTVKGENVSLFTVNNDVLTLTNTATVNNRVQTSTSTTTSHVDVIPVLNIPLIEAPVEVPQQNQGGIEIQQNRENERDSLVDDLFQNNLNGDEMESLMDELMKDPDLRNFFSEVEVPSNEIQPMTVDEEVDAIINEQIQRIDAEFKKLIGY